MQNEDRNFFIKVPRPSFEPNFASFQQNNLKNNSFIPFTEIPRFYEPETNESKETNSNSSDSLKDNNSSESIESIPVDQFSFSHQDIFNQDAIIKKTKIHKIQKNILNETKVNNNENAQKCRKIIVAATNQPFKPLYCEIDMNDVKPRPFSFREYNRSIFQDPPEDFVKAIEITRTQSLHPELLRNEGTEGTQYCEICNVPLTAETAAQHRESEEHLAKLKEIDFDKMIEDINQYCSEIELKREQEYKNRQRQSPHINHTAAESTSKCNQWSTPQSPNIEIPNIKPKLTNDPELTDITHPDSNLHQEKAIDMPLSHPINEDFLKENQNEKQLEIQQNNNPDKLNDKDDINPNQIKIDPMNLENNEVIIEKESINLDSKNGNNESNNETQNQLITNDESIQLEIKETYNNDELSHQVQNDKKSPDVQFDIIADQTESYPIQENQLEKAKMQSDIKNESKEIGESTQTQESLSQPVKGVNENNSSRNIKYSECTLPENGEYPQLKLNPLRHRHVYLSTNPQSANSNFSQNNFFSSFSKHINQNCYHEQEYLKKQKEKELLLMENEKNEMMLMKEEIKKRSKFFESKFKKTSQTMKEKMEKKEKEYLDELNRNAEQVVKIEKDTEKQIIHQEKLKKKAEMKIQQNEQLVNKQEHQVNETIKKEEKFHRKTDHFSKATDNSNKTSSNPQSFDGIPIIDDLNDVIQHFPFLENNNKNPPQIDFPSFLSNDLFQDIRQTLTSFALEKQIPKSVLQPLNDSLFNQIETNIFNPFMKKTNNKPQNQK